MLSLVDAVATIKAKDEITIQGDRYFIQNVIAATDGNVLRAHMLLIGQSSSADVSIKLEIASSLCDLPKWLIAAEQQQ